MRYFLFFFIFSLASCHLEVNTTDPQASASIDAAKKEKFFKKEYRCDSACGQVEAWIEEAWKYEIVGVNVKKLGLGGNQLILKFKKKTFNLPLNRFLVDWRIVDSAYGIFGSGNGVFILDLKDKAFPDKFDIYIRKMNEPNNNSICRMHLNVLNF
jgi:hypothetical protein